MKGYQALAQKVIFDFNDAYSIFKNKSTTYGGLNRLVKEGLIKKVRNNLYVSINPSTGYPFATKYQIGSSINSDAYISHLSALEFYGYQNQVNHICYVSSFERFNSFEFEGVIFKYIPIKSYNGVVYPPYSKYIKITDVEKTLIDTIHGIDLIVNLEELVNSMEMIPKLDQNKILKYLEGYQIQALYQKTGYLISLFNDTFKFEKSFFENIKKKIHKSVVYISNDAKQKGIYINDYQIVVPKWLQERGMFIEN